MSSPGDQTANLLNNLTKPPGSLGFLEDIAIRLSEITGVSPPRVPESCAVAVFAGDHGVVEEGVTPWPSEVTSQMVLNFLSGGAAINVLARHVGASVTVIDVGVAGDLKDLPGLVRANVRAGTRNLANEDPMTDDEVEAALNVGRVTARDLAKTGCDLLATGDMGIGNTTPSAALIGAYCKKTAREVTGRGTGIDNTHFERKLAVVDKALARLDRSEQSPTYLLRSLGGLEIAAIAGFILEATQARVPVVVDGVISLAGALAANAINPQVREVIFAGHRSTEPAAQIALDHLGLRPILSLDMRLGEGTGACLAMGVIQAAAKITLEMATFDSAGVTNKDASQ